jgi:hypothetical protein
VEHFRHHVAWRLNRQAKAMIVTSSRLEAVRYKLALDHYIRENHYQIGALVAFSGEVNDLENSPEPFTETGQTMNPGLKGRDIRDAFDTDEYSLLLVANKYQNPHDPIDLSQVRLTHHSIRNEDVGDMGLKKDIQSVLDPASEEAGSAPGRDRAKALLNQIIATLNDLFEGLLTREHQPL